MWSPEEIIGEVACITAIPAPAITGRRRTREIVYARFLAIAAVHAAYPSSSLQSLATLFSRRDHGSIIHAHRRHRDLLDTDPTYLATARRVCRQIFTGPATLR